MHQAWKHRDRPGPGMMELVFVARQPDGSHLVDVEALAYLTGRTPPTIAHCCTATPDGLYYAETAEQSLAGYRGEYVRPLVTTREAAVAAKVPPGTIRSWASRGLLKAAVPGTRPRYDLEDVMKLAPPQAVSV